MGKGEQKDASQACPFGRLRSLRAGSVVRTARPGSLDFARDRLFAAQKRLAQDDKCTFSLMFGPANPPGSYNGLGGIQAANLIESEVLE
jgi:hypothetical protein